MVSWVSQSVERVDIYPDDPIAHIAACARTAYQSETKGIQADKRLVRSCIERGHDSVLEHASATIELVTSRAIANELTRHRHCSFTQESTRYVNYFKRGFRIIKSSTIEHQTPALRWIIDSAEESYNCYVRLLQEGVAPEIARDVLPLCAATKLVVTANFRQWRYILKLRSSKEAHPDMRYLVERIQEQLSAVCPIVFGGKDV